MSDLNTKATVQLQINGQQAEQTLQQLRSNALQLETAIAKAAAAGNKTDLRKLRRELSDTKRQIREMESSTMQVESVMKRLDKASPRDLQRTLSALNKQLEYMERGSEAWKAHALKIRQVKDEMAKLNSELRTQESVWERFNRKLNDWQTSLMGMAAAATGIIMAGRSAVNAYAEMDAEMANVRKFTGMDAEEVEKLNEEFKKIDTLTSREDLNKLAQEAGRLGKSSQEDVMGFVKAADQINVALDDLGDGATLTLSKLTNIFGDEKVYGTEKALLKVGSVINELSQNCTASAPYLANFAQRMAGVGAQAQMSIPQIMGFAAVLDSQGQAVEMSATALSKLIMDMFKQKDKVIAATGIDAQKFNEELKKSTNDGLLFLLETLSKMGNIDALAPVFKDMGENGARAAQVISALAGNLDMVKWEQQEATKAFEEGTSVTKEFNVQNNTVQAGLDKARKGVAELAVELGEKLQPVMSHVYSSTTLLMRVMSLTIDFIIKYWAEIKTATILIAAYTIGVNAQTIATRASAAAMAAWNAIARIGSAITKGYTTAMVLSKDAVVGCSLAHQRLYRHMLAQNVVTKLLTASSLVLKGAYYACTLQISALRTTLKSLYVVMAANPYGLLVAGIAAVATAIYSANEKRKEQARLMEEECRKQKELMKDYDSAKAKIAALNSIINDNTRDLSERKAALDELKKIVPDYHADLDKEGRLINSNTAALDDYLARLKESILMRANREKLEQLYMKQSEVQEERDALSNKYWDVRQNNTLGGVNRNSFTFKLSSMVGRVFNDGDTEAGAKEKLDNKQKELDDLNMQIAALEKKVKPEPVMPEHDNNNGTGGGNSGSSGSSSSEKGNDTAKKDRFEAEDNWKKQEEAINRIAYAKGEKDYIAYRERMMEIEKQYNQKKLEHTDLSETERLEIEAAYYEARKKIADNEGKKSVEDENNAYAGQMAALKQRFIDGLSSYKVYEEAAEQAEMAHLQNLVTLYEDGSKEKEEAQKALQEKAFANQKKHLKEVEDAEKKHQEALKKMKEEVFGDNPAERQEKYSEQLALLTEVYNAEIAAAGDNAKEKLRIEEAFQKARLALIKEYNIEGEEENGNFLQNFAEDLNEFLDSDLGQAITGGVDTIVSGMASIFQQLSSIVQAELEIQLAQIEKRYDAEVSLAEGNNYKVKRLEKQKQADIAKAKNEANKKMYAMQVIQAVAQTATAALNAYSSAAAVPLIGYILAPVAAGMAVAAGMLQVAAIKKQQQAAEAQGYSEGGFTPDGRKDEVAGVVHAGEWVASQKLVKNPATRPLIEALDYAQRTNTVGSLTSEDVSRTITAPAVMAQRAVSSQNSVQRVVIENDTDGKDGSTDAMREVAAVIASLNSRLNEPFITVNSVTGEAGMKQAQDEYDKLIRNKTPKSRRV